MLEHCIEYAKQLKQIFEFPKKQPANCWDSGNGWNHRYSPLKAYFTKVLLQKEIEEKTRNRRENRVGLAYASEELRAEKEAKRMLTNTNMNK